MPTIKKTMYVCLCVAEGSQGGDKRGSVSVESYDYGAIWGVQEHINSGGKNAAYVLLKEIEIDIDYTMPTAEEQAEISLPIMEAGLQKLRADFVVAESKLLADIASIKQLTYKGPLEGDFVAAADAARELNPRKAEDVEDAEIVPPANNDKPLDIPF